MSLSFQGLRALVGLLPLPAARALGRSLGLAAYWLLPGQRNLALSHLAHAFGETLAPARRRAVARGVFVNLGLNAVEWLKLPQLSTEAIQRLVACDGVEHLRAALTKGRGAVVVSGHFGNWELMPIYLRSLGFEGGVLARELRYPEYESFLVGMRQRKGVPTLARGSLKDVAKLLRANRVVGMMPDQDIDSLEGLFVPFFGHDAYTPVGPAALAVMTGAPIVPCFILREGTGFRLRIEPPIPPPKTADRARALRHLTLAWSEVVESYVRRYPDHWAWMHRRWKTRPPDSPEQAAGAAVDVPSGPAPRRWRPGVGLAVAAGCALALAVWAGRERAGRLPGRVEMTMPGDEEGDQRVGGFTLTGYRADGAKRWEMTGERASVDRDIVTVHWPDGIGYDAARTTYLTARLANFNQRTRAVRLEHNVTIHTSEGLWFTTPLLYWIPDQQRAVTDEPVRVEAEHLLIRGRGLRGHSELREATILRDVELVLNPSEHESHPPGAAKHVTITCDGPLTFDYEHNIATFEHNVHVRDPSGDLYSDRLIAYLDAATHTIRYAEAIGRVRIEQEKNVAHSERAVYQPAIGKITLVGKPSLLIYPSDDRGGGGDLALSGLSELVAPEAPTRRASTAP